MSLIVYFDEVGNPTLDATDKDFPVFAIAMFICDDDCYVNQIVPQVQRLKFKWFGHEGVILHSRDIRKAQGDFGILTDASTRQAFLGDLNGVMTACDYKLLAVAIRKDKLVAQYRCPAQVNEMQDFVSPKVLSCVTAWAYLGIAHRCTNRGGSSNSN